MARAFLGLGSNLGDSLGVSSARRSGSLAGRGRGVAGLRDRSRRWAGGPGRVPEPRGRARHRPHRPRSCSACATGSSRRPAGCATERWGPRTLDVDILWIDGRTVDEPDLQVPHPRMCERRFVMAPLADLAPDLVPRRLARPGRGPGRPRRAARRPTGLTPPVPHRCGSIGPGRAGRSLAARPGRRPAGRSADPWAAATTVAGRGRGRRPARDRHARRRHRRGRGRRSSPVDGDGGRPPRRLARPRRAGAPPAAGGAPPAGRAARRRARRRAAASAARGSRSPATPLALADGSVADLGGRPFERRRRRPGRVPRRRGDRLEPPRRAARARPSGWPPPPGCRSRPTSTWCGPPLDNVAELGPAAALTGPAARGDWATVDRHLAALDPPTSARPTRPWSRRPAAWSTMTRRRPADRSASGDERR